MPDSKKRWAAALFVIFAVIYAVSRNRTYPFDGLLFAGMVETDLFRVKPEIVFEWNHFLWYPTGRVFYLLLHALRIPIRGYEALQLFNALVGAAGVAVAFHTLSRLVNRTWALGWSIALGFCAVYWMRSAGAENYLLGTFWAIGFADCLLSYWEKPSYRHMIAMLICAVLSAYYHLGNLAIIGAAFLALILRQDVKGFLRHTAAAAVLFAALWTPYAYVHQWYKPGGFGRWWTWSKGLAEGYSPLQQPGGGFEWTAAVNVPITAQTFLRSMIWSNSWSLWTAAFIALAALAMFYRKGKAQQDRLAFVFLIPLISITALYAVWLPGTPAYWSVHSALFCIFAGALSGRRPPERIFHVQWAALALIIVLLAAHNMTALVLPDKTNSQQFLVDAAMQIGQSTPAQSPVIISGRGEWSPLKPYLPYFGHRNRLSIDLFAVNSTHDSQDPVTSMQDVIAGFLDSGVPIYITDDALKSTGAFSDFHLTPQQIESIWKPFERLPIRDLPGNPPNRLYLLWSNRFPPQVQESIRAMLKAYGFSDQLRMITSVRSDIPRPASHRHSPLHA